MGIDRTIDYQRLAEACFTVQRGAKIIGTNDDIRFPTEAGFVPGNGSLVRLSGKCLRGGASIYWEAFTGHAGNDC